MYVYVYKCILMYVNLFQVSLPAEAHSVTCGVDHMVALCRSFA